MPSMPAARRLRHWEAAQPRVQVQVQRVVAAPPQRRRLVLDACLGGPRVVDAVRHACDCKLDVVRCECRVENHHLGFFFLFCCCCCCCYYSYSQSSGGLSGRGRRERLGCRLSLARTHLVADHLVRHEAGMLLVLDDVQAYVVMGRPSSRLRGSIPLPPSARRASRRPAAACRTSGSGSLDPQVWCAAARNETARLASSALSFMVLKYRGGAEGGNIAWRLFMAAEVGATATLIACLGARDPASHPAGVCGRKGKVTVAMGSCMSPCPGEEVPRLTGRVASRIWTCGPPLQRFPEMLTGVRYDICAVELVRLQDSKTMDHRMRLSARRSSGWESLGQSVACILTLEGKKANSIHYNHLVTTVIIHTFVHAMPGHARVPCFPTLCNAVQINSHTAHPYRYIDIYIYIYRERERERKNETGKAPEHLPVPNHPPSPKTTSVYFHQGGLELGRLDLRLRLRLVAPDPPQPVDKPLGHDGAHARGRADELVEVRPPQRVPPVGRRQQLLQVEPAAPVARLDGVAEVRLDVLVLVRDEVEGDCFFFSVMAPLVSSFFFCCTALRAHTP